MSFSKYFFKLQNLRMCMLKPDFVSDYMSGSDHKYNFLFLGFPCDFSWTDQQSRQMCWSLWSKPGPTFPLSVGLWITMRSCCGGHDSSWKELGSLLFPLQQWGNPVKLFSFVNGFIIFLGAITHSYKLHPLWLVCGPGSLSWWDARRQRLDVKSWTTVDNMWFSCPGSGSGWAAVVQLGCLQQCRMRNPTS